MKFNMTTRLEAVSRYLRTFRVYEIGRTIMAFKIDAIILCDFCDETLHGHEVWITDKYETTIEELNDLAGTFGWRIVNGDMHCAGCLQNVEDEEQE